MHPALKPAFLLSALLVLGGVIGSAYLAIDHIEILRQDVDQIKRELEQHRIDAAAKEAIDQQFNREIDRLREDSHTHR